MPYQSDAQQQTVKRAVQAIWNAPNRATAELLAESGFRVFAGVRKQADWDALHESLPQVLAELS